MTAQERKNEDLVMDERSQEQIRIFREEILPRRAGLYRALAKT